MIYSSEVVICTYNGENYIEEQLVSILHQTRPVKKIRIYDDNSSDGTISCINNFINSLDKNNSDKFKLSINSENLGYAKNFCQAINNATEDIIFLCDQDDIWEANKVDVLLSLFEKQEPDMVFSDGILIDQFGREMQRPSVLHSYGLNDDQILSFQRNAFDRLLKRNYINGAASAVRRQSAQEAMPLPCDMPHDFWLAIWCALHKGIIASPDFLYRYRQHEKNVIGMGAANLLYDWLGIWRQPRKPRERDLKIWKAVTERITELDFINEDHRRATRKKLEWLTHIVSDEKANCAKIIDLAKSSVAGDYRRYATPVAFLRDLVAIYRRSANQRSGSAIP